MSKRSHAGRSTKPGTRPAASTASPKSTTPKSTRTPSAAVARTAVPAAPADGVPGKLPTRTVAILGGIGVALSLGLALYGFNVLPADVQVPTHWNAQGVVDATAGRTVGLLMVPAIQAAITALLAIAPRFDPRSANLARSARAYVAVCAALTWLFVGVQVLVLVSAAGASVDVARFLGIAIGLVFMVIGNELGKVRSNFMFGIRTPWTLTSERAWLHAHRVGGWGFTLTGLATVLLAAAGAQVSSLWVLLGGLLISSVGALVVSYRTWRTDPDRLEQR